MVDKTYIEEIEYRKTLHNKVVEGIFLTEDEKLWLDTHKEFSAILGYPYLKKDYVLLKSDTYYRISIKLLKLNYPWLIYPCITVPHFLGGIASDSEIYNISGKKVNKKEVKMLVPMLREEKRSFELVYHSDLGGICISFECECVNKNMKLKTSRFSHHNAEGLYMIRDDIDVNKIMYSCRGYGEEKFDSLVFSFEWNEITR